MLGVDGELRVQRSFLDDLSLPFLERRGRAMESAGDVLELELELELAGVVLTVGF